MIIKNAGAQWNDKMGQLFSAVEMLISQGFPIRPWLTNPRSMRDRKKALKAWHFVTSFVVPRLERSRPNIAGQAGNSMMWVQWASS